MDLRIAMEIIEKCPGFSDETSTVGEAFAFLKEQIHTLQMHKDDHKWASQTATDENGRLSTLLDEVKQENERLRKALEDAAKSLETIRDGAGMQSFYLEDTLQIRGYANSRAIAARQALAGDEGKEK